MKKLSPMQRDALAIVAEGAFYPSLVKEDGLWYARWLALSGDNHWVDEYVRAAVITPLTEDAEDQKHETLHDAWMGALKSYTGIVRWDDAECAAFAEELKEWSGAAEEDSAARKSITFTFRPDDFAVFCKISGGRRALRALGQSMFVFPPLGGLKRDGDMLKVPFSRAEAESFLRSGARELSLSGYTVEGVELAAGISAEVELSSTDDGNDACAHAGASVKIEIDGESVTAEELRFLLDQGSSLVFFRDRWIEVDRNLLKVALRALERNGGLRLSVVQALSFALGIGRVSGIDVGKASLKGWLRGLVNELKRHAGGAVAPCAAVSPEGFEGKLMTHQRRGVAWLTFLAENGFGALLADDMGLGKTAQVIAWALERRRRHAELPPVLVVAPLTLLSNWAHEFSKFAPSLEVYVHHGENRHVASGFRRTVRSSDVVITSYSMLVRDYAEISENVWDALVIDEAQAVKNPDTQAARAIRALSPPCRIALTGTPVENSVLDVWAIEDFLNPGFLGERKEFIERFVKPISADERSQAGAKLRHALEPFVLRRLKNDVSIAGELGEKREIKEYCSLTAAERREYETALEDYRISERRRGDVFALITRLKQICDGEGKLERLIQLLEAVFESGESVLVFTQFVKTGEWIKERLKKRFSRDFPFLHGSLTPEKRDREIRRFNSRGCNAFILSLKAGGFGLNLTKATHVIHFDRWWNPAVENQATDRAHRIGQRQTVFVHQFITSGTLEERVDEILERKSRVAGTLVQSGESFLSQLDEGELAEIVRLEDGV